MAGRDAAEDRLLRFADALKAYRWRGAVRDSVPTLLPAPSVLSAARSVDPLQSRIRRTCAHRDSGAFKGRYHVLGGTLDPVSGRTPDTLWIAPLLQKMKDSNSPIREVILAFDPDVPGDTTSLYLKKHLLESRRTACPEPAEGTDDGRPFRITRLARGLPNGAALEYADEMTVADALEHRREG